MENILEISKLNKSYTDCSLTDISFSCRITASLD